MVGVVSIVCSETARYSKFHADIQRLIAPEGIEIMSGIGSSDSSLSMSRNEIVEEFLKTDADWLMMVDDDHAINEFFLVDLIRRHMGKPHFPILSTVYLTKKAPFVPTLYGKPVTDEKGNIFFPGLFLNQFPTSGIVPVYATGASCMMVRRIVYQTLPYPWYKLGQSDHVGEDMWFCHQAQLHGFPVHVDMDARIGHIAPFEIWPHVLGDEWIISLRRSEFPIALDAPQAEAGAEIFLPVEGGAYATS